VGVNSRFDFFSFELLATGLSALQSGATALFQVKLLVSLTFGTFLRFIIAIADMLVQ